MAQEDLELEEASCKDLELPGAEPTSNPKRAHTDPRWLALAINKAVAQAYPLTNVANEVGTGQRHAGPVGAGQTPTQLWAAKLDIALAVSGVVPANQTKESEVRELSRKEWVQIWLQNPLLLANAIKHFTETRKKGFWN